MKNSLIALVKSSKLLYSLYYFFAMFLLRILRVFVKKDEKCILINSFGGKKFDDSPKAVYEALLADNRFKDWKITWAFHNPELFTVPDVRKVKIDTIAFYITALKAKVWITNSSMERGLTFKRNSTIQINTWHGSPIKMMGTDISSTGNKSFASKKDSDVDIMNSQSDFEADIFSRVFGIERKRLLMSGLPRNDVLFNYTDEMKQQIRETLGIKENKKVVLYAPTFREYDKSNFGKVEFKAPFDPQLWSNRLGDGYVLLLRLHYEVAERLEISQNSKNVIDVSKYPQLNDLIIASDMLVSDYSSIIFDYAITENPVLLYAYDYDKYVEERGVYFDIRDYFTNATTEEELLNNILNYRFTNGKSSQTAAFKKKYVQYGGDASKKTVDTLYNLLNKELANE